MESLTSKRTRHFLSDREESYPDSKSYHFMADAASYDDLVEDMGESEAVTVDSSFDHVEEPSVASAPACSEKHQKHEDYLMATSAALNNIGALYHEHNAYEAAMKYYSQSLARIQIRLDRDSATSGYHMKREEDFEHLKKRLHDVEKLEASLLEEFGNNPSCPKKCGLADIMRQRSRVIGMNYVCVPIRNEAKHEGAIAIFNFSLLYHDMGNFELAIELLNLAIDTLSSSSPPYLVASVCTNLGYTHYLLGRPEEAMIHFHDALEFASDGYIFGGHKVLTERRPKMLCFVVVVLLNLARAQDACKCYDDAIVTCREVEVLLQTTAGSKILEAAADNETCFDVSAHIYVKACVLHHMESITEARGLYQQFAEESQAKFGQHHPCVAAALHGLGMIFSKFGDPKEAMRPLLTALDIRRRVFGNEDSEVVNSLLCIGPTLKDRAEFGDALGVYKRALMIQNNTKGHDHSSTIQTACDVVRVHQELGELDKAVAMCRELLQICQARDTTNHEKLAAYVLSLMGSVLIDMGRAHRAKIVFFEAYSLHQDEHRLGLEIDSVKSISCFCFRKENRDAAAA